MSLKNNQTEARV